MALKRKAGILKGQVLNPKGNPNIGQIAKEKSTGPRTDLGKWKMAIKQGLIKTGKYMKTKRRCSTCPLQPMIIRDNQVMRCPHYEKGSDCKLLIGDWKARMEAFICADELGERETLKLLAMEAHAYSLMNAGSETIKKGAPSRYSNEFLKTAGDMLEKAGKLNIEKERVAKNIPENQTNVQVLNVSNLIKEIQTQKEKSHSSVEDATVVEEEPAGEKPEEEGAE